MSNRNSGYDGLNDVGPILCFVAAVWALVFIVCNLGGCNTVAGVGADLQALGNGTRGAMTRTDASK